jgi:putative Holliday junction resolvase
VNDKPERWLGIDYGDVRIGVAISDPLGLTARGLETIRWNSQEWSWAQNRIADLVRQYAITGLVIGVPRRTDGKPGISEAKARLFAQELAVLTGLDPVLRDERFTTVLATRVLQETGIRGQKRKSVVDQVAAEIILQDYLESRRKDFS